MPFRSQAQARWMFANRPAMAREWADKTPSVKALPKRVSHQQAVRAAVLKKLQGSR